MTKIGYWFDCFNSDYSNSGIKKMKGLFLSQKSLG